MNILNPGPSFGEKLGSALANALGTTIEQKMQLNKEAAIRKGAANAFKRLDPNATFEDKLSDLLESGVPMNNALQMLSESSKAQERQAKTALTQQPKLEKIQGLQNARTTVDRMRDLGKSGLLGFGLTGRKVLNPSARKLAGEYEQLGKSLIQYASTIPVRNQKEFDVLSKQLIDPSIPDAEREGVLDAMQKIIDDSISMYGGQQQTMQMPQTALATEQLAPQAAISQAPKVQREAIQQPVSVQEPIAQAEGIEQQEANAPSDVPIPSQTDRLIDIVAPNLGAGVIGGPGELIKGLTQLIGFGADLVTGKQIGSRAEEIDKVFKENLSFLPQFDNTKKLIESYAQKVRGEPIAKPETELEQSVAKYAQAFGEGAATGTSILNVMSQGMADYAGKNGYGDFGQFAFSLMPFIARPSQNTKELLKNVAKDPKKLSSLPSEYLVSKKQNIANKLAKVLTKKETRKSYAELAEKLGFEPPIEAAKKGTITGAVKKVTEKVPGIGAPVMKETEATKKAIKQRIGQLAPEPTLARTEIGQKVAEDIKQYNLASRNKVNKAYGELRASAEYDPKALVAVTNLSGDRGLINAVKKEVMGLSDPAKNKLTQKLNELESLSTSQIAGKEYKNRIPLEQLIELKKDFGQLRFENRGTNVGRLLGKIDDRLDASIKQYGNLKPDLKAKYYNARKTAEQEFRNREKQLYQNIQKLGSSEISRPEAIIDRFNSKSDAKLAKTALSTASLKELQKIKVHELFSKGLTAEGNIKDQVLRVLKDPKKSEFYKELLGTQEYNDLIKFTEGLDQLKKNAAYLVNNSNTAEQQKIASMLTKLGTIAVGGKVAGVTAGQAIPLALSSYAANKFLTSPSFKKALIHLANKPKDPNRLATWTKTSLQLLPLINRDLTEAASDDLENYVIDALAKERSEKK